MIICINFIILSLKFWPPTFTIVLHERQAPTKDVTNITFIRFGIQFLPITVKIELVLDETLFFQYFLSKIFF